MRVLSCEGLKYETQQEGGVNGSAEGYAILYSICR